MKKLLCGNDVNVVSTRVSEIKQGYRAESISVFEGNADITELRNAAETFDLFGNKKLVIWFVDDKKYITDEEVLNCIKNFNGTSDFLAVARFNIPRSSRFVKVFDSVESPRVPESREIFIFLDAMAVKDSTRVISVYYTLINSGMDPIYINQMIFYQIKNILMGLCNTVGFASLHPFVKSKLKKGIKLFDENECVSIISDTYKVDKNIKTSNVNGELEVLNLALKITKNYYKNPAYD